MLSSLADMPIFINVLTFIAIFLFCMGVNQFLRERSARKEMVLKIKQVGGADEPIALMQGNLDANAVGPFAGSVAKIGSAFFPIKDEDYSQLSRVRFLRAGYRQSNAPSIYWGLKILLAFLVPAVMLLCRIAFFSAMTYQATMMYMILCAVFGFYLPDIWLRQKSDKRKEKLLLALPDALDLLVICVEAGIGIDSAFLRVAQEIAFTYPELSDEFQYTNLELRAGKARFEAMRNLALRTNLTEINSLVTLLNQTDKFGTSIAGALRVYSDTYRTERYQKAEELAAKLPVKMLFPLVVFIFPAMFVVLLGPAAISIYNNFINR